MNKPESKFRKKYLTKEQFAKIEVGDKLYMCWMLGDAYAVSKPDEEGTIMVEFKSGPWKGKTLEMIRQQIHKIL